MPIDPSVPSLINLIWDRVIESIGLCPANRLTGMGKRERRIRGWRLTRRAALDVLAESDIRVRSELGQRTMERVREEYHAHSNKQLERIASACCGGFEDENRVTGFGDTADVGVDG